MCKFNMEKNHFVLNSMDQILDALTRGLDIEILQRGFGVEPRGVPPNKSPPSGKPPRSPIMPLKTHLDEQPTLNLTPMIDIVCLLIIFFMVGTKFSELERKIGLEVPSVADSGTLSAAPARRVVNVYRDGSITLDREAVTLAELTENLAVAQRQYSDLGVLIRGDASGQFQRVAEVLNASEMYTLARRSGAIILPTDEATSGRFRPPQYATIGEELRLSRETIRNREAAAKSRLHHPTALTRVMSFELAPSL